MRIRERLDELGYTISEAKVRHAIGKLEDGEQIFSSLWDVECKPSAKVGHNWG